MDRGISDFERLVREYQQPLVKYASRIIGDPERALDVVQEVFVELQRRLREQTADVSAKWLFTVCRNRALNVCRKERRLAFVEEDFLAAKAAADDPPFERLQHEEATAFLMRILATLPPRQQELLQLRFQNDLSYQDISEITNLSVTNVGVMIHNALKALRQRYRSVAGDFIALKPAQKHH